MKERAVVHLNIIGFKAAVTGLWEIVALPEGEILVTKQ
jgi:hypothetical protein